MTPQAIADLEEARSEHAFELWRSWQQEHALTQIERDLTKPIQTGIDWRDLLDISIMIFGGILIGVFMSVLVHGA